MHWLDITILVALGIGATFGFWSGLLWQIARVVSLAAALYLAIILNTPASEWLGQQLRDTGPALCRIIAFAVIFLAVYVTLYLLTRMLHEAIKATRLETADRVLGALLGLAKMAAVVSLACAGLLALGLPLTQTWMEHAVLAPHFARGTDWAVELIPKDYREKFDENVQQARDQMQKKAADAALEGLAPRGEKRD